jgi:DNA segregation ATPase FtsK/SpoIIIE, S-DNA-T family
LGQLGAECLLGQGDMLYLSPGTGMPVRLHGAYVSRHETEQLLDDLRKRAGEPHYFSIPLAE